MVLLNAKLVLEACFHEYETSTFHHDLKYEKNVHGSKLNTLTLIGVSSLHCFFLKWINFGVQMESRSLFSHFTRFSIAGGSKCLI